jgi:23S rRNA (adenine2503-C2)-methyltransferase
MDLDKVTDYLKQKNVPSFRSKQIYDAYFKQSLSGFNEITNLPLGLREELSQNFPWLLLKPIKSQGSPDQGVIKTLFSLGDDGGKIESVLMFYRDWITACVSVMVGCPLGCSFCATGQAGFKRNLSSWEIVDQIVYWNQILKNKGERINNIVFMGMGEPFLNWEKTFKAIKVINDPEYLNIGARHITISTAGIIPGIKDFADLDTQINLAISLHSPFQEKREQIMPVAKKYSLLELMNVCKYYVKKTNRKLFFEYATVEGFNDRPEDAAELKKLFTEQLYHLNLINLNPTKVKLSPSSQDRLIAFTKLLDKYHIPYTLRRSLGTEIQAACGQLAGD